MKKRLTLLERAKNAVWEKKGAINEKELEEDLPSSICHHGFVGGGEIGPRFSEL